MQSRHARLLNCVIKYNRNKFLLQYETREQNIFKLLTLSHEEQFFDLVMIRPAVIADDAEFEAFGREPSTFDEASLKNSLRSKFSYHRAKNAVI